MTIAGNDQAFMFALFGVARFGATRFGYLDGRIYFNIGGVGIMGGGRPDALQPGILVDSLTIADLLNERPNTCGFVAWAWRPTVGQLISITIGSENNITKLFAGYVINVNQRYQSKPENLYYDVSCIDHSWRLQRRKVTTKYTYTSATDIVRDVIARFAPLVTTNHVQAGLPILDVITFTNDEVPDALLRVAARIGAYFYVDYDSDLHFFTAESQPSPLPLTPTHPTLSAVAKSDDLSQIITRVISEGGGVNALTTIPPGESSLPVDTVSWYGAGGGVVRSGPQFITYAGVAGASGAGALVGPGVTPGAAPSVAGGAAAGAVNPGAHGYAYTWQTASGETLPSPVAAITLGPLAAPVTALTSSVVQGIAYSPSYAFQAGDVVEYAYAWSPLPSPGHTRITAISIPSIPAIVQPAPVPPFPAGFQLGFRVVGPRPTDPGVKSAAVFRRVARSGAPLHDWEFVTNVNVSSVDFGFEFQDGGGSATFAPAAPNSALTRVAVSAIAVGAATVTARKLYRTAAGSAQLKLLTTIADNVTTTYDDGLADAALGANAPAGDTSGLQTPGGQVNPGAIELIVASAGWASAAGGWAIIGNGEQVIRYTGIAGNKLTGIPPSGTGAIVATVAYNSTITAAPALTGIPAAGAGAIVFPITKGDAVNVVAIINDAAAQAALAALLGPPHDGIVEESIADGRLSLAEATARGNALLAQKSAPTVTLRYNSRDSATQSGAMIAVDLPPPTNIHSAGLKLQQVTIDSFDPTGREQPTYHALASSDRFSLEDLLRQARTEARTA